jgi:hypothetical protein
LADDVCKGWRQYCGIKEKENCGCNATDEMGRKIETNKSQNFRPFGMGTRERMEGKEGIAITNASKGLILNFKHSREDMQMQI